MYFLFALAGLLIYLLKCYISYQSEQPRTYYITRKKEQKENLFTKQTFDENSTDYFNDLIKVLILCTYNSEKLKSIPYVDSPFRGLGEDIEFVFTDEIFKSMFRNKLINADFRLELLTFKETASTITEDEWFFEKVDLDHDNRWKEINKRANELLSEMQIEERSYNFDLGQAQ